MVLASVEFELFLEVNGIRHLTSVPYHAVSNGLADHAVQIVKQGLKKVTQGSAVFLQIDSSRYVLKGFHQVSCC